MLSRRSITAPLLDDFLELDARAAAKRVLADNGPDAGPVRLRRQWIVGTQSEACRCRSSSSCRCFSRAIRMPSPARSARSPRPWCVRRASS